MDLLFKRYASPFLLVDQEILYGEFSEFADGLVDRDEHDKLWQFWLHKVFAQNQSFQQWKDDVSHKDETIPDEEIEATVLNSLSLLQSFEI